MGPFAVSRAGKEQNIVVRKKKKIVRKGKRKIKV